LDDDTARAVAGRGNKVLRSGIRELAALAEAKELARGGSTLKHTSKRDGADFTTPVRGAPTQGFSPGFRSLVSKTVRALNVAEAFQGTTRQESARKMALERRRLYCQNVLPDVQKKQFIKFDRGLVSFKDIINLWKYFNDIDLENKGRVTMADVRKHRREKLYGHQDNVQDFQDEQRETLIVSLLGSMNTPDGVTFKAMLAKAYPEASKADLEKCLAAIRERAARLCNTLAGEGLEVGREYVVSKEDVREADTIFNMFDEDHNGVMCEKEFLNGMYSLTGQDDQDEITYVFEQLMDPVTRSLSKKDFRFAWLNMFRKGKQLTVEEIQKVGDEIDAEAMAPFENEIADVMKKRGMSASTIRHLTPAVHQRSRSTEPERMPPMTGFTITPGSRQTQLLPPIHSRRSSNLGRSSSRIDLTPQTLDFR